MKKILLSITLLYHTLAYAQNPTWESYFGTLDVNDAVDYQGDIWVATNRGLYSINKTTENVQHYNPNNSLLEDKHIQILEKDLAGNLWIGTYDLLLAKRNPTGVWDTIHYPNMAPHEKVTTSTIDQNNKIWLITTLRVLSYDGQTWQQYSIPSTYVYDVEVGNDGNLRLLADSLYIFDTQTNTFSSSIGIYGWSLTYIYVQSADLHMVNDSLLWVVHASSSPSVTVSKLENDSLTAYWEHTLPEIPSEQGTPNFATHPNGSLCYTAKYGKLIYYDNATDTWIEDNQYKNNDLNGYQKLMNDSSGDLWVFGQGVAIQTNATTRNEILFSERKPFSKKSDIVADKQGKMYVTNNDGWQPAVLKITNGIWDTVPIPAIGVNNIAFDSNNNIWATGYVDKALPMDSIAIIQQDGNIWTIHSHSNTLLLPNSFYPDDFNQIVVNKQGTVWVLYGDGIIYQYKLGVWNNVYNTNPSSTDIKSIKADTAGNFLWMETTADLKKYDISNNLISTLSGVGVINTLGSLAIDPTNGNTYVSGSNGTVQTPNTGIWTQAFTTQGNTYGLNAYDNKVYAAYKGLHIYDNSNGSVVVYDTTSSDMTITDATLVAVNPVTKKVWLRSEQDDKIDVMTPYSVTSLQKTEKENNPIQIYPNPSSDFVYINTLNKEAIKQVQLIDGKGQVLELPINKRIDIQALPAGLYWLRVTIADKQYVKILTKK